MPCSPLSTARGTRHLVFSAQMASKVCCVQQNPARCHFSPSNIRLSAGSCLRGHLVLVTPRHGPDPGLLFCDPEHQEELQTRGVKQEFGCLFSSSQSSKAAEICLTCGLVKCCLSYRRCSCFLSRSSGLIRRTRSCRVTPDGDLFPLPPVLAFCTMWHHSPVLSELQLLLHQKHKESVKNKTFNQKLKKKILIKYYCWIL